MTLVATITETELCFEDYKLYCVATPLNGRKGEAWRGEAGRGETRRGEARREEGRSSDARLQRYLRRGPPLRTARPATVHLV